MSKTNVRLVDIKAAQTPLGAADCRPAGHRPRVALLSNPKSTGNLAQLSRIRAYCADHPDIFHYEVEHVDQIADALRTIARVRPKMLVINGGDGTVQAALTEMHNGGHFGDSPPPMAVIPSGKTNLIALDLGVHGDPIEALERLVALAQGDLGDHIVERELIALRNDGSERPVIGMFLGGAGLADTMLYCRNKIYPLGLPNAISHVITALALMVRLLFDLRASFLPPRASPLQLSAGGGHSIKGRYTLLIVTTLEKLLLSGEVGGEGRGGPLKFVAIEERPSSVLRGLIAGMTGGYKGREMRGVHFEEVDEVTIEGESSNVILDGETFRAELGRPIRLRPTLPLSFVRLAA